MTEQQVNDLLEDNGYTGEKSVLLFFKYKVSYTIISRRAKRRRSFTIEVATINRTMAEYDARRKAGLQGTVIEITIAESNGLRLGYYRNKEGFPFVEREELDKIWQLIITSPIFKIHDEEGNV